MTELAMNVKLSVGKMTARKTRTLKTWTKVLVCALSLPLIPLGVMKANIEIDSIVSPEKVPSGGWKDNFTEDYIPVIFSTLSIGLTIACTCLIVIMKKYFHKSLKTEVCRIQTIFLVFMIGYLSRAVIYYVLTQEAVYEKMSSASL